jgi:hypothetical protein
MKSLLRDILGPKERGQYSEGYGSSTYGTTPSTTYGSNVGLGQTYGTTRMEPTFVEKKERAPVIQETVLPEERVEIQPIIHREREQLEVHQVVQPMRERDIVATEVRSLVLPAETRQEVRESDVEFQRRYQDELLKYNSGLNIQPVKHERFEKPPIVEEIVRKKVIEEIQPIIYRETIKPVIIQETLPIYEKIVEAPRMFFEEQRSVIDLGVKNLSLDTFRSGTTYSSFQQPLHGQQSFVPTSSSFQQPLHGQQSFVPTTSFQQPLHGQQSFVPTTSSFQQQPLQTGQQFATSGLQTGQQQSQMMPTTGLQQTLRSGLQTGQQLASEVPGGSLQQPLSTAGQSVAKQQPTIVEPQRLAT